MARGLTTVFAQVIITTTIFALNVFFTSLAGVLRLLPQLVPLACRALRGLLVLSCRFYYFLLSRLAPPVEHRLGIDLTAGFWRLGTTLVLSFGLGTTFLWLLGSDLNGWVIGAMALHGLFVDLTWDEIPQADALQMGEKIKWDN